MQELPIQTARFSATFDGADQMAETLGFALDFKQLEPGQGSIRTTLSLLTSLTWTDFEFDRAFHQQGKMPAAGCTFGFTYGNSRTRWSGTDIGSDHLVDCNGRSGFETRSYSNFSGSALHLDREILLTTAEAIGVDQATLETHEFATPLRIDPISFQRLQSALRLGGVFIDTSAEQPGAALAVTEVEAEVYRTLVECLDRAPVAVTVPRRSRWQCLRRAIGYISAHSREAITVADLCRVSCTTGRTLERAFLEEFGVSPKRYIQLTRLSEVRRELYRLGRETSVCEVALAWGFWHMSQFAQDYQRMFGELPSETRNSRPVS